MPHTGNDIVDLNVPGTINRGGDERFLAKVLTKAEKGVLRQCWDPDRFLWAFWAAKETAFKAVSKTVPKISASPKRYPVVWDRIKEIGNCEDGGSETGTCEAGIYEGVVETPARPVAVRAFLSSSHVHCVGATGGAKGLDDLCFGDARIDSKGIKPSPAKQSQRVRKMARENLAGVLDLLPGDIRIRRNRKNPGPPRVYINQRKTDISISLSHHGRFAAFAFLADKKRKIKWIKIQCCRRL